MASMVVSAPRRAFDWLFRDRRTGDVVIAQRPNAPLLVFLVATAVRLVLHPHGAVGTLLSTVASIAIGWWSVDEILRGVNPFRRALGVVVLAAVVIGFLTR